MNNYREITEATFIEVAYCIARLGFSQEIATRSSYSYSGCEEYPINEEYIRHIVSDNAQFIVPVTWSSHEAIGLNVEKSITWTEAIGLGWDTLLQVSSHEIANYRNHKTWRNEPDWGLLDSYIHSSLRGTIVRSNGFFRQGYLVVCKGGISIVGHHTDWTPESELQRMQEGLNYQLYDLEEAMMEMYRMRPTSSAQYSLKEVTYIPYSEIQNIAQQDVLRLDGLAALMTFFSDTNVPDVGLPPNRKFKKAWLADTDRQAGHRTPLHKLIDLADEFPNEVVWLFEYVIGQLAFGQMPVTGTGLTDGVPIRNLFSWGLVANIVDARRGTGLVVESIFNELDTALALIADLSNSAGQTQLHLESLSREETSPSPDLAVQLQKLSELHASGALTDEEFTNAKKRLLS